MKKYSQCRNSFYTDRKKGTGKNPVPFGYFKQGANYFAAIAWATATATSTEAPTIGLLPIPIKPIISTWAGTLEEPAN